MVKALAAPSRPLPAGGDSRVWTSADTTLWCRVYHVGPYAPEGDSPREYGPLARFDPQLAAADGEPRVNGPDRSVLYVGSSLETSACEVFGEAEIAQICSRWRIARLEPVKPLLLFDLTVEGSALAIGAKPMLADGDLARSLTQGWARAIYEDEPLGDHVDGIVYRSAYEGGESLVLWGSAGRLRVLDDQWFGEPAMFNRLTVAFARRLFHVEKIADTDCNECKQSPSR